MNPLVRTALAAALVAASTLAAAPKLATAQPAPSALEALPVVPSLDELEREPIGRAALLERLVSGDDDVARAREALALARSEARGARGVYDPLVTAELNLNWANTPTRNGVGSGLNVSERYEVSGGFAQVFRPGTRLDVSLQNAVTRSEFPLADVFGSRRIVNGPDFESMLTLSATQPLLRGFGREVTEAAITAARRTADVRTLEILQRAGAAALEALTAYAELRFAYEQHALRARSLERTQRQLEISAAELEAGQIAPIELDLVRERIAANQEALLLAYGEVLTRSRALRQAIGDPSSAAGLLSPSDPPPAVEPPAFSPEMCEEAALANAEIAVLEANVELARVQRIGARDGRRPSLDVTGGLAFAGLDAGWANAWGQVASLDAPTLFGTVVFSTPLGNRAAREALERAELSVVMAQREVERAGDEVCFQVRETAEQAVLADARAAVAAYRVGIAERALSAEQERFVRGLSTVQSGLDALENLEQAESQWLRAQVDAQLAALRLDHLRGRLLERLPDDLERSAR